MTIPSDAEHHYRFESIPGYFQQDDPQTDDRAFDFTQSNFGLIDQKYDSDSVNLPQDTDILESQIDRESTLWQRFIRHLRALNEDAAQDVSYRLMFLGRHGQGWHNVAEDFYGTEAWDCYYSTLDGNDTMTWSDAHLTDLGISQAQSVHDFWVRQIQTQKMPLPESYYVSPMDRAIHTAAITFRDLPGLNTKNDKLNKNDKTNRDENNVSNNTNTKTLSRSPLKPIYPSFKVHELTREVIGIHTCDRRSSLTQIKTRFPTLCPSLTLLFPSTFSDPDPLWSATQRESPSKTDSRTRLFLDSIFSQDSNQIISVTSHSGVIASFLRVVGHREFHLSTGAVIPVLLKVEKIKGKRWEKDPGEWVGKPDCSNDVRRRIEEDRESGRDGLSEKGRKGIVD